MNDSSPPPSAVQQERPKTQSERLLHADPDEFHLSPQGQLRFNELHVATLCRGKSLTEPGIQPALAGNELLEQLRAIVQMKIAKLMDPLVLEDKTLSESDNTLLRSMGEQLGEGLGTLRIRQVQGLVRALHGTGKNALKDGPLVLGRRHIYAPENLTPKAVVTRLALLATYKGLKAPELWKPAQVLILDQQSGLSQLSTKDFERLGYEQFAERAVRVDVVERVLSPNFLQKKTDIIPSLMHTFRCSEDEARSVAKQLKLSGPTKKRGPRTGGKDEGRTRSGRNRSGGRKSAFR